MEELRQQQEDLRKQQEEEHKKYLEAQEEEERKKKEEEAQMSEVDLAIMRAAETTDLKSDDPNANILSALLDLNDL